MSDLHVHNTLTRKKEKFEPINPPYVGLYVCGPTLYNKAHLGNLRSFISFDVVYRYLMYLGYKVRYVRNITDVGHLVNDAEDGEDKVEKQARIEQLEPMEIVQRNAVDFHRLLDKFNLLPPSIEPTATGHIIEQIEMVQRIIDHGYGYEKEGSVYFDVEKYMADGHPYGVLSGRKIDELMKETRELEGQSNKKNPQDFVIWKGTTPDKIMKWNSPWGEGVPGWHLECSVMSTKYLGQHFDIHGGGMDLKFPHHDCEIAQSVAADGNNPVKYWLHGNMLTVNGGEKMSKSKGNSIMPDELMSGDHALLSKGFAPPVIRFFMMQAHYSSELDITSDALEAAEKGYRRLMESVKKAENLTPSGSDEEGLEAVSKIKEACENHMNDDFNTPKTIASLYELSSLVNKAHDGQIKMGEKAVALAKEIFADYLFTVMGIEREESSNNEITEGLMDLIIELRKSAREKKDWDTADTIRDSLKEMHVVLKDGKEGTTWSIEN